MQKPARPPSRKLLVATIGLCTVSYVACGSNDHPPGNLMAPPDTEQPPGNLMAPPGQPTDTVTPPTSAAPTATIAVPPTNTVGPPPDEMPPGNLMAPPPPPPKGGGGSSHKPPPGNGMAPPPAVDEE